MMRCRMATGVVVLMRFCREENSMIETSSSEYGKNKERNSDKEGKELKKEDCGKEISVKKKGGGKRSSKLVVKCLQ